MSKLTMKYIKAGRYHYIRFWFGTLILSRYGVGFIKAYPPTIRQREY